MNGGTYITSDNYPIAGLADAAYLTNDAVFEIDDQNNIAIVSGTVTLGQDMNTMPGQTLTVNSGATFVVPTGKTLNVYSTVNVDGTLTVDGTIYLKDKDATITVDDANLNVLSGVDGMDKDYRNGVYYLVEGFVAQIVRGGEVFAKYPTVSGALAEAGSGDTVQVLADVTENTVLVVMGGVTLDLNGHKLGAIGLVAFTGNHVIDSASAKAGRLTVNGLSLTKDNKHTPIKTDDGYLFTEMNQMWTKMESCGLNDDGTGEFEYRFKATLPNSLHNTLFSDGAVDNEISMSAIIEWTEENKDGMQIFDYSDDFVKQVYSGSGLAFSLKVTGVNVEKYTNLKVRFVVQSTVTGVEAYSDYMAVNFSAQ